MRVRERQSPHAAPAAHEPGALPVSVRQTLRNSGQPLDQVTRRVMEPRFGHDFGRVRIHVGPAAAESAREMRARAFTVGSHVVFGSGQHAPATPRGQRLMAHELAHVVQQRNVPEQRVYSGVRVGVENDRLEQLAERQTAQVAAGGHAQKSPALSRPVLQRNSFTSFVSDFFSFSPGPISAIARAFGSEKYSDQELQQYLTSITTRKAIEDHYDSDNKARAVVKRWTQKKPGFDLKAPIKTLLIREMQTGHVSGDDERGILTILHNSQFQDLQVIFGAGGIDPKKLDADFDGAEKKDLRALYDRIFEGGTDAVSKGSRELTQHVKVPYQWSEFKKLLEQQFKRIETAVNAAPDDQRNAVSDGMARSSSNDIYGELKSLAPAEREQALQDMSGERSHQDALLTDVRFKEGDESLDAAAKDALAKQDATLTAVVLLLDLILQTIAKDMAIAAPAGKVGFEKTTTPLSAAQKKAAQAALKPLTHEEVVSEVSGKAAPPAAKFVQKLPGEKDSYDDQIRARAPKMVDEYYARFGAPRSEAVHSDKSKTHQLDELEKIANASAKETDRVFGNFKKAPAFTADQFNKKGVLTKSGNIHDAWLSEQAKAKSDPGYQARSADFWMFYLLENDNDSTRPETVQQIEFKHNASPELDKNKKPLNPEAKVIAEVGNKHAKSDAKRLFEIGRGWDAFNIKGGVSVQLFKNPDTTEDRKFLWDMFFTLIHEYLHTLADGKYDTYANSLGGEHTAAGNTLIEGVDSLLTETVWTSARPRASQPDIRNAVEPDAVKAGEPFDASLVPESPWRRYSSYPQAVKLVSVVGIRNLYDAYFYGNVKAIGG